jgi:hypothetical protein
MDGGLKRQVPAMQKLRYAARETRGAIDLQDKGARLSLTSSTTSTSRMRSSMSRFALALQSLSGEYPTAAAVAGLHMWPGNQFTKLLARAGGGWAVEAAVE